MSLEENALTAPKSTGSSSNTPGEEQPPEVEAQPENEERGGSTHPGSGEVRGADSTAGDA